MGALSTAALPSLPPVRGEWPFWIPAVTHLIKTITSLVFQWRSLSSKAFSLAGEAIASDKVAGTQVLWKARCYHRLSHLPCPQKNQNTEWRWPNSAPEPPSPNSPCLMHDFDPPRKDRKKGNQSKTHDSKFIGGGGQVAGTLKANHFPLLSLNLRAVLKGKNWKVYLAPSWLVLSYNSAEEELYAVQQIPQWNTTNGKQSQNFS